MWAMTLGTNRYNADAKLMPSSSGSCWRFGFYMAWKYSQCFHFRPGVRITWRPLWTTRLPWQTTWRSWWVLITRRFYLALSTSRWELTQVFDWSQNTQRGSAPTLGSGIFQKGDLRNKNFGDVNTLTHVEIVVLHDSTQRSWTEWKYQNLWWSRLKDDQCTLMHNKLWV